MSSHSPKSDRFSNPYLHYGLLTLIYGVGLATLLYHTIFHGLHLEASSDSCAQTGPTHQIMITKVGFAPQTITAKRCDVVTFINNDTAIHLPAFGEHASHDHSLPYTEKALAPGQTNSATLTKVATIPIHDHLDDTLQGTIHVTP